MDLREYIRIEDSLTNRLYRTWVKDSSKLFTQIGRAVREKDFSEAYSLAEKISFSKAGRENREYIKSLLLAAAKFGSKLAAGSEDTILSVGSYSKTIDRVTNVFLMNLEYNIKVLMQRSVNKSIAKFEKDQVVFKADRFVKEFVSFNGDGRDNIQIISSLHSNRLSVWGFMGEADVLGYSEYKIDAVIDERTSNFCNFIDGTVFQVEDGRDLINEALEAQNPDDLRQIQPWPGQSEEDIAFYSTLTPEELVERGLCTPPYHPSCRTLCVPIGRASRPFVLSTPEIDNLRKVASLEEFEELGIDFSKDELRHWNDFVQMSPVQVISDLANVSPQDVVEKKVGSNPVSIDEDGLIAVKVKGDLVGDGSKVSIREVIDPYEQSITQNYAEFSGTELSAATVLLNKMMKSSVQTAKVLDSKVIYATAVGAGEAHYYTSLGYLPLYDEWQSLRTSILRDILRGDKQAVFKSLTQREQTVVLDLLNSKNEKAITTLIALPITVEGIQIGKILLENKRVETVLYLTDGESLERFGEALE